MKEAPTIAEPEVIKVVHDAKGVHCDGGGALGHPKVWYSFDKQEEIECLYCGRRFVRD